MHYDIHGQTSPDAPTILLSSGLGGSGGYWAPQIPALSERFRVITYDHRGCGMTGGTAPENGGISDMADDVLEIVETLKLEKFHFMGHALGGLIGLDLALRRPELIQSLILINAWSKADPHSGRCFDVRIALLENAGVEAFVKAQPLFLYPAIYLADHPARLEAEEAHALANFQGKTNLLRRIAALRAFDVDGRLGEIGTPTLVIATRDDMLVPYSRSLRLTQSMQNATLRLTVAGGHACNVTYPQTFNSAVLDFLSTLEHA